MGFMRVLIAASVLRGKGLLLDGRVPRLVCCQGVWGHVGVWPVVE